jgi:hypothetical protein
MPAPQEGKALPWTCHETATAKVTMVETMTTHCSTWVQVTARIPPKKEHNKTPPKAKKTPNSKFIPDSMDATKPMA